jgi:hypothetical protein
MGEKPGLSALCIGYQFLKRKKFAVVAMEVAGAKAIAAVRVCLSVTNALTTFFSFIGTSNFDFHRTF